MVRRRGSRLVVLVAAVLACLGSAAYGQEPPGDPLDQGLPAGALSLDGASPGMFVSRTGGIRFRLAGAELDATLQDVVLTINGLRVPADRLVIGPHLLTAHVTLVDGRNTVSLKAYDTIGRPLYHDGVLWAGSATLLVKLVDEDGAPFLQPADVVAELSDERSVGAQGIATTGSITFTSVPARALVIEAKGIGNEIGSVAVLGTQGAVTVKMIGFNQPSEGWVSAPGTPVRIVPHTECIPGSPR